MSKCPFHANSAGISLRGEIESITCNDCGDYRISKTALDLVKDRFSAIPAGWGEVLKRRALISTRDTRLLQA
ncbi:MAG: hypothetical protein AAF541_24130 [Pseudomonadota bacterium]